LNTDLREPSRVGWKTGVIIRELEEEVRTQNSLPFRTQLASILEVTLFYNPPFLSSPSHFL